MDKFIVDVLFSRPKCTNTYIYLFFILLSEAAAHNSTSLFILSVLWCVLGKFVIGALQRMYTKNTFILIDKDKYKEP